MPPRILTALPVYNEASHLTEVLDEVSAFADDILVVDDGSTDGTGDILAARTDIQLISHGSNRGYGASLQSAFEYAGDEKYEILITIDCDGQHEPRLIPELAAAIHRSGDHPVDLVSGSRYLQAFPGDTPPPEERRRINREITELLNQRLGTSLSDAFCGFKAYRVASLEKLKITESGYAMPLQLWVQAVAADFSIVEFPVPLIYLDEERSFGGSLDDGRHRMAYYLEVIECEMVRLSLPCPAR